ncbi:MAG TPA: saccharopine dehydrogenase C-terminal domain-containing protein [Candidatus Acidoferrum sp.]|nr:saccharopine dehydrogenase C-terminal domain-containing protein [Candidatus Acidoferrum sp.]
MRFTVLGAGMMGCATVYDLGRAKGVTEIVVGDFDLPRAEEVAKKYGGGKARAVFVDVRNASELAKLLAGSGAVLNCTQYYWNLAVMKAALEARVNYLDLGGLFYTTRKQLEMDEEFRGIGKLAILGIGSAPGIANVMARYLADQLDRVEFAGVYNGSRDFQTYPDAMSFGFSIATILDELTIAPMEFTKGKFVQREHFSGAEPMTFKKPIGKLVMRHSIHSEVATLPLSFKSKGIQGASFKINYDPQLIQAVQLLTGIGLMEQKPVKVGAEEIAPRAFLEKILKSRPPSGKTPKDVETIRVIVRGKKNGKKKMLSLDATAKYTTKPDFSAVARDTGFPISVAAQMIASGGIEAKGVQAPETAIPAREFLREMDRRGIRINGGTWR